MEIETVPESGRCHCGREDFTLAKESTQYTSVKLVNGQWEQTATMGTEFDGNVRLFCPECATYYEVPEVLA